MLLTSRSKKTNSDGKPFSFTFAYHTYFSVSDISEVQVEGLKTLDYLDNVPKKERFTEQGDALTFESEEKVTAPSGKRDGKIFYLTPMLQHSTTIIAGSLRNKGDGKHKREGSCVTKGLCVPEAVSQRNLGLFSRGHSPSTFFAAL